MTSDYSLHFIHHFFSHFVANHSLLFVVLLFVAINMHLHAYIINNSITSYLIQFFFFVYIQVNKITSREALPQREENRRKLYIRIWCLEVFGSFQEYIRKKCTEGFFSREHKNLTHNQRISCVLILSETTSLGRPQ